jgi:FlaA1/EpsC-like NDP-sugar epimerase
MRRYFISIPEAVGLALHAAALAEGSDVFVLEMGEQIKVLDLARNLIRLFGFIPGDEIPITLTGCRPGEKLCEEVVAIDEEIEPSLVEGISRIRPGRIPRKGLLMLQIEQLQRLAMASDVKGVVDKLREIVPTYVPTNEAYGPSALPTAAFDARDVLQHLRVDRAPSA